MLEDYSNAQYFNKKLQTIWKHIKENTHFELRDD